MWFVLFSILMDVVGFGIVAPILPFYVQSLGAGPEVVTLCLALHTGFMFVSTPIWGRLSDRYGRKPIMCFGLFGATASYAVLATADSIWMIAVSRIFGGLMAAALAATYAGDAGSVPGVVACFGAMAANAALIVTSSQTLASQAASEDERGVVLGVFSSVGTLARTSSTVLSGVVYSQVHVHGAYWAAALMAALLLGVASTLRSSRRRGDPLPGNKS